MQGVLDRVQEQLQEQRLMRALSQRRGQTIDIQIGFNVYLDVPQEMRSRLWLVVLKEPSLAIPFQVCITLVVVFDVRLQCFCRDVAFWLSIAVALVLTSGSSQTACCVR